VDPAPIPEAHRWSQASSLKNNPLQPPSVVKQILNPIGNFPLDPVSFNLLQQATMRYFVKGFAKVHVDNVYCTALIYLLDPPFKTLNQICASWFSTHKAMLTAPNQPLPL